MSGMPDLLLPKLHTRGPLSADERESWPTPASADAAEYTRDEDEFIQAVLHFRTLNRIGCPTLCQMLWVLKRLGYRKGHSAPPRSGR